MSSHERSVKAYKHIVLSFFAKGLSMLVSLLIVPLTITYVNPTQYGIWLTLSSIIAWAGIFDLGLGNGLRNKFSEAMALNNKTLAIEYVSTTYFIISIIALSLFIVIILLNNAISWANILNISPTYTLELRRTFFVIGLFFSINLVSSLFMTILTADQRPGWASMITGLGQSLSLLCIWGLTKISAPSLVNLAFSYTAVPCVFCLIVSVISFSVGKYKEFRPRFSFIRWKLIKDILSLGCRFFIISLSMLFVFQCINIMMNRYCGPDSVTTYNIAYKYFNLLWVFVLMIITPYWTSFNDAWNKKDYAWMISTIQKLKIVAYISIGLGLLMLLMSSKFYTIWIGENVVIPLKLSIAVLLYVLSSAIGNIYMYMINGIGKIRLQMIVYIFSAIIALPATYLFWKYFGQIGIVAIPTIVYFTQAYLGRIQINKLIKGTATGIWNR